MKELKINTPLSYFVVGKFWAKSRSASWPLVSGELQKPGISHEPLLKIKQGSL